MRICSTQEMEGPVHKALRLLVALFAVLALGAAACGGDDGGDEEAADSTEESTTTTEATTTTTVDPEEEKAELSKLATDFFAAFSKADFDTTVALMENGESHRAKFVHCENLTSAFSGIEMKD